MTQQLLNLRGAAERLAVHPSTLRRWADNGDVAVLFTPGGHRRFDAAVLDQFIADQRTHKRPDNDLPAVWQTQAIEQTRKEIGERPRPWMGVQSEENRLQYRALGQQLVGLAMQYIAADDDGADLLVEADGIGRAYAAMGMTAGLSLTDALSASMFFHDTLIETSLQLPETARIRPDANRRILRRINKLLNAVHLAIAKAYEGE